MTPEQWWGAALFMLVSSITPGPNNTMLMASGVHFGYRRTLPHLMGVQLGFGFMLIAVGLGLHAVLAQFPAFYDVVRFAGGAYMVWMAWSLASARPRVEAHTAQGASGYGETQAFEDDVYQPQAVIAIAAKQSKDYGESSKPGLPPRAAPNGAGPPPPYGAEKFKKRHPKQPKRFPSFTPSAIPLSLYTYPYPFAIHAPRSAYPGYSYHLSRSRRRKGRSFSQENRCVVCQCRRAADGRRHPFLSS